MVKHINTTREDASWVDDYGIVHYWPGENTTTTYYVHSTVLSGRTIAEVNSNGTIGDTFVYAGSARIATDHHFTGGSYSEIELSNPVTGASFTTDASGSYSTRKGMAYNWGQAFDSAIFEFDLMLLQALPALVNSVGLIV